MRVFGAYSIKRPVLETYISVLRPAAQRQPAGWRIADGNVTSEGHGIIHEALIRTAFQDRRIHRDRTCAIRHRRSTRIDDCQPSERTIRRGRV